jgi:hypothetical protein
MNTGAREELANPASYTTSAVLNRPDDECSTTTISVFLSYYCLTSIKHNRRLEDRQCNGQKFEDTKGVVRSWKSKDRQYNGQKFEDTKGVIRNCKSKPLYFLSFCDLHFWLPLWYLQTFDHYIVCPSLTYSFWLPLWYLQILAIILVEGNESVTRCKWRVSEVWSVVSGG